MTGTPLATSSHFNMPPPKLHVVRNPSNRARQAVRDNNVPLLNRLQHKTDLRNTDRNRLTSLSWAAIEGSLEVFEWLLLDYGHDDQELSRDSDNNTILHLLASVPSLSLSPHSHLLASSPFPPKTNTLPLATQSAISLRMTQLYHTLFPFLLDWSNTGGKTALHVAAQAGNAPFINLLCDMGADVDLTDLQGNTPLHYASAWGHLETVKVLLERGCQFAARNFEGFTASEFAYSDRVMNGLQTMARGIFEERRSRRKEEREVREGREVQRMRSGSVSTSASMGSGVGGGSSLGVGSYSSGQGKHFDAAYQTPNPSAHPTPPPHPPLPLPYPQVQAQAGYPERTSSLPMSRRGSDQASLAPTTSSYAPSSYTPSMPGMPPRPGPAPLVRPFPNQRSNVASPPPPPPDGPIPPVPQHGSRSNPTPFPRYPAGPTSAAMSRPSASVGPGVGGEQEWGMPAPPEGAMMGSVMRRANSAQATGGKEEPRRR